MEVPLIELMMWLEQTAGYIHGLTHPSTPRIFIDLLKRTESALQFELSRGDSSRVIINVWLMQGDPMHTERVSIKNGRDMEDLGDLKACICARLLPSMRVLNLLNQVLQDKLELVFFPRGNQRKLVMQDGKVEIWLDEHDRINVKGGQCLEGTRTYLADETAPMFVQGTKRVFYFEDPFAQRISGAVHALMPATMEIFTDVLGALGLETLGVWEQPLQSEQGTGSDLEEEEGGEEEVEPVDLKGETAAFRPGSLMGG